MLFLGLWCKFNERLRNGVRRLNVDQALRTAVQISGAVFPATRSLPNTNWPFLMRCMSSMPAIVIDACQNRLNPSIGPNRSLMDR